MRKLYLRIFVALIGLASLGIATRGQDSDHIRVKIPFQFVVNGKTLPAGTYTVTPLTSINSIGLILADYDEHAIAIVLPTEVENRYSKITGVSLEQTEGQFVLSQIRTTDHSFKMPVSHAGLVPEAEAKAPAGTSGSEVSRASK